MNDIAEAKQRLPLPALMHRFGLGDHARKNAHCPFHADKHSSFSVWRNENGWFFKCHAGCGEGDEINFLEIHKCIPRSDATKLFLQLSGVDGLKTEVASACEIQARGPFYWRICVEAFTDQHVQRLADWRGLSGAFCCWLRASALVGLHEGCIA